MEVTVGNIINIEHPLANSYCAMENTRLAIAESDSEQAAMLKWLKMKTPTYVSIYKQITLDPRYRVILVQQILRET